jgi:hypothetical protein
MTELPQLIFIEETILFRDSMFKISMFSFFMCCEIPVLITVGFMPQEVLRCSVGVATG